MRRLMLMAVWLVTAYALSAQGTRFTSYVNTIADLAATPVSSTTDINRVVTVKYATALGTIDSGGTFYYSPTSVAAADGSTVVMPNSGVGRWIRANSPTAASLAATLDPLVLTTNGSGQITTVSNRTLPFWVNVKDPPYGAAGDGSDDTTKIKSAYDGINKTLGGTLYFPPGNYKFNLTVTNKNIKILGSGGTKDYTGAITNYFTPAIVTSPVIQIGDNTNLATGFRIQDVTFQGITGTDQVGIGLYGGAYEGHLQNVVLLNFYTNILAQAGSSLPCSLIVMDNVVMQPLVTRANARGLYLKMPDNQNSYTTAISWMSGHVNCPTNTTSYGIEVDGTSIYLGTGFYLDGTSGHGIYLNKSGVGQPEPIIDSSGFTLDITGSGTGINLYDNSFPYGRIVGPIYTSSKIQLLNGTNYDIPRNFLTSNDRLYSAVVHNPIFFSNASNTNSGKTYITGNSSDGMDLFSSGSIKLNTATSVQSSNNLVILAGSVFLDNAKGLNIADNGAVYEAVLSLSSANNLGMNTPSSGGDMIFYNRKGDGHFKFLSGPGATNILDIVNSSVTVNKALIPVQVGNSHLAGTDASGNLTNIVVGSGLSLSAGTLTATGGGTGDVVAANNNNLTGSNTLSGPTYFNGPFMLAATNLGSGTVVDFLSKPVQIRTLTANTTLTSSNERTNAYIQLITREDNTGGWTLTFNFTGVTKFINATNQSTTPPGMPTNATYICRWDIYQVESTNFVYGPYTVDSKLLTDISNNNVTSAQMRAAYTDEVGTGPAMFTRVGVVRSIDLPMGAWFTNGIASPATPVAWTNTADSFQFIDAVTNTIRLRLALPLNWDAGVVRAQLVMGSTLTNNTTSTNVVYGIKGASIGTGEFEDVLTFGTQTTVTNHVHRSPYKTTICTTGDITVGNTPAANKNIVLELTRMSADATDVNTNTISLVDLQLFYTESATEGSMPASTN